MAEETPMVDKKMFAGYLFNIIAYNGGLQVAHWLANTINNEHKALGDLYEAMVGLVDILAESYMGKNGVISFVKGTKIADVSGSPCAIGLKLVDELESCLYMEEDAELLNITADMRNALNKACYLLKE
jgi:hypothetical protein